MADTKNSSIHCTVSQCAHHCMSENYCTLESINVGTHETVGTSYQYTYHILRNNSHIYELKKLLFLDVFCFFLFL